MSYTKQTWNTGDAMTVSKMRHIEDGVYGLHNNTVSGPQIVCIGFTIDDGVTILGMTWKDIRDHMVAGDLCIVSEQYVDEYSIDHYYSEQISEAGTDNFNMYYLRAANHTFECSAENDYPTTAAGGK